MRDGIQQDLATLPFSRRQLSTPSFAPPCSFPPLYEYYTRKYIVSMVLSESVQPAHRQDRVPDIASITDAILADLIDSSVEPIMSRVVGL